MSVRIRIVVHCDRCAASQVCQGASVERVRAWLTSFGWTTTAGGDLMDYLTLDICPSCSALPGVALHSDGPRAARPAGATMTVRGGSR